MAVAAVKEKIATQLEELQKTNASIKPEELVGIVEAVIDSMEGDMTAFYIAKKIAPFEVRVSSIARGIPVGSDLEFTDEITLARSLLNRTEFSQTTGTNNL